MGAIANPSKKKKTPAPLWVGGEYNRIIKEKEKRLYNKIIKRLL